MSGDELAKVPPHDIAAEEAVLGGMMLSDEAVGDVAAVISAGDHYRPGHQMVHAVITDLAGRGEPHDIIAVKAELERRGEIARVGGAPYLHTLIASVPTAANAAYYARIVADRAAERRLIETGTRLVQAGYQSNGTDRDELLAFARSQLEAIGPAAPGARLAELRAALLDSEGLDQLPVPEPLIDGLLFRDSLAWLHGKPGHAKSLLSLDWACCIDAGLGWQKLPVTQGGVLYVIAEGATGLQPRVRAWEDRARQVTRVKFLPVAIQLLRGADASAVASLAAEMSCALVVVDTQARVSVGAEENSATDMGRLVEAAEEIRAASRACVLFVHHEARAAENMRGSTALEGAADTILRVTKDGPRIELTNPKQKNAAEADPVTLWVVPQCQSVVIAGQPILQGSNDRSASETKIMGTLLESFGAIGASASTLRAATGLPESTFHWALNRLVKAGSVQNLGTRNRSLYVPSQERLPADTPTTPTDSNSILQDSNPPIGDLGGLESDGGLESGWPPDTQGEAENS